MESNNYNTVIIGAGLSGLAVATFLKRERPEIKLAVLEQGKHVGGAIRSFHQNGYLAEWGAHGFLDNCPESRRLLRISGLGDKIQKAPLGKFVRYICLDGKLRLIPQSPIKIMAADLMPLRHKLRVLADLWKKPRSEEQSMAAWAAYRFGPGVLPFLDAVVTGTSAGDMEKLSIDAVMPGVRRLELEHGSVIRGLIHKQRLKRRCQKKEHPVPGEKRRLPAMVSFAGGMEQLPRGLASGLKENQELFFSQEVMDISRADDLWLVHTREQRLSCRNLVLALPVNASLKLLGSQSISLPPPPCTRIAETRIATVVLGFTDKTRIPFGFGYLAPERERRFALGAMFSSHMFPGRAPEGHVLVEALVGGRRHPERLDLDDDAMIRKVLADLGQLLPLDEEPCFAKVLRQEAAFPQLEMGYPRLLAWRDQVSSENQGLFICGFGWEGIGINDMVKQAHHLAVAIAAGVDADTREAEVKGVYF